MELDVRLLSLRLLTSPLLYLFLFQQLMPPAIRIMEALLPLHPEEPRPIPTWSTAEITDAVSNLSPDTYAVTATDSRNCTAASSAIILNASSLVADVTLAHATCFGS